MILQIEKMKRLIILCFLFGFPSIPTFLQVIINGVSWSLEILGINPLNFIDFEDI